MYQDLHDKVEITVKIDVGIEFYNMARPLYLGTVASSIRLLQVRDGICCGYDKIPDNTIFHPTEFASMSLSNVE